MARRRPRNSEFWRGTPPSWTALVNWYRAVECDGAAIVLAQLDLMLLESTLSSLAWLADDERVERFVNSLRETAWPGGGNWADQAEEDLP
jgi:hypothetical protein